MNYGLYYPLIRRGRRLSFKNLWPWFSSFFISHGTTRGLQCLTCLLRQPEREFHISELIAEQLGLAVGLGGKKSRAGSHAERARSTVTKRLKGAIDKIGEAIPVLGRHLPRESRPAIFALSIRIRTGPLPGDFDSGQSLRVNDIIRPPTNPLSHQPAEFCGFQRADRAVTNSRQARCSTAVATPNFARFDWTELASSAQADSMNG